MIGHAACSVLNNKMLTAEILRIEKSIQSCIIPPGVYTGEILFARNYHSGLIFGKSRKRIIEYDIRLNGFRLIKM